MFIFWGTKAVTKRLGYAADFCPICREIRGFQIGRLGRAGHLYGVSLGAGELVGHLRTCLECGVTLKADAALYKELTKARPGADVAALVATTFPGVRQHHAERLAIEDQVALRPGPLDAQLRAGLIREPFLLLAPAVEKRFSETHVDVHVLAALGLTVVASVVVAKIFSAFFPGSRDLGANVVWATIWLGIAAAVFQGFKAAGRYLRKAVYPMLARALRPLEPSPQELEGLLAELKRQGLKLGKKARLKDLLEALKPGSQLEPGRARLVR